MVTNTKLFDGVVIFTHLVNSGSFTSAAELTGHSTSYISKELNKLEERLGVRLMNRTTRSISLTPEGKLYYQQCMQLVHDAEHTLGEISQSEVEPRGTLRVSCPVALSINYFQPILSEYMHRFPKVNLELDLNDRKVDLIQDGFDVVIRATHQLEESSLICRKLFTSPAYIVASHEYLKKHGTPKHPEQLKHHKCICYTNLKQPNRWTFIDKDDKNLHIEVPTSMLCNSSDMELKMVLDGHGICRLPAFTMQEALNSGELSVLFDDYNTPEIDVFVVYPSRKHLSPKVRSFIDLITTIKLDYTVK